MASDQSRLQNMIKKEHKGFKEYAHRWPELAAQVQPPITEREMVTMFIDTLPSPYYDRVVGNVASNFADLVVVGERIELGIQRGKLAQTNNNTSFPKKTNIRKEEGQPRADTGTATNTRVTQQGARRSHRVLALIPMTYTKLFPLLLEQNLIEVVPLKPLEPPYPRSYDLNTRCDYHGGAIGHATERCWSLKHKVQDLLDDGLLRFEDKGPNVHSNPLSAHGVAIVNAISHDDERVAGPSRRKDGESGQIVDSANRVEEGSHPYQLDDITTIAYIKRDNNPRSKPLIIQYNSAPKPRVPFIIQVPVRPVYNNNAVPWRYSTEESQTPQIIKETTTPKFTNIAGVGGMTWSRRIISLETLRNKDLAPAKREIIVESPKRMVTEEEAHEFLKIIRHGEYEMLNQLHKMPARIWLLSLLINSESHQELLLKILNNAHVPQDITPAKFGGIINNITMSRHLSFFEEKVSVKGKSHN
ncbi:hypothetical protein CR513_05668, partial [Mucuna pruriens]